MEPAQPVQAAMTHGVGIQDQLLELFLYLGAEWILYLLLLLSVVSIGIALERIIHFVRFRDDLERLQTDLNARLRADDLSGARSLLETSRSHVAKIALRGLDALDRGAATVEEIIAGATGVEKLRMERGLAFLGTLGNNAPFIGLFGTVLGIIRSFRDLSTNTIEGSQAVMAGIAEALVATAVGLLVALPAVAVFNLFQRTIKSRLGAANALARIVLAHAKAEPRETK